MAPLIRRTLTTLNALVLAAVAVSCSDTVAPPVDAEAPAAYIAVKVAWLPGERAAFLNRVMTNHELVFLYAGDVSDLAPQLYADPDSHVVVIANPLAAPSLTGPILAQLTAPQFSTAWNFNGLKITSVNNTVTPADTTFWHLTVWSNPADALDHGFAIAGSRLSAFNITPTNSVVFDASGGKSGAATGEYHASTGTLWIDNSTQGIFKIQSQTYPGAFSSVTSGPYLGGQVRAGSQFGRISNSVLTRTAGAEAPLSFTVDFDYRSAGIPSVEILCVFPTPCTTNVPAIMAAWRAGQLPGSLTARLPGAAPGRVRRR